MCGNRHVSTGAMEARTLGSPEPELQVVISCLMWELGIELRSPEKAIHWAISSALRAWFKTIALWIPMKGVGVGASAYTSPVIMAGKKRSVTSCVQNTEAAWQLPGERQVRDRFEWASANMWVSHSLGGLSFSLDRQVLLLRCPLGKAFLTPLRCHYFQSRPPNSSKSLEQMRDICP